MAVWMVEWIQKFDLNLYLFIWLSSRGIHLSNFTSSFFLPMLSRNKRRELINLMWDTKSLFQSAEDTFT